ncbi:MAG: hypothetical protein A2583_08475 [Bdellovibrionales bacterium RIFOXYD1_FULL_53_11]|nr:MAG: hypothetical protein A2583_08475 [Bdellovibrionales bacterium RIFOXYD1_FULL_53_11]
MGTPQDAGDRWYQVNPVEVIVFILVLAVCMHSVYNLFYDRQGLQSTSLSPMSANPVSEGRTPASTVQSFVNLDLGCDPSVTRDTQAVKMRILGAMCGPGSIMAEGVKPLKTKIVNQANRFEATIFTDMSAGKYSTDYIPLSPGQNQITIEFAYPGDRAFAQNLIVNKTQ